MSRRQFVKTASAGGYGRKEKARQYIRDNPKESYTQDDLIALWRKDAPWPGKKPCSHGYSG